MKRMLLNALMTVVLLLVLCAPAALAENAAPEIAWDMTVQDMYTLEGVTQDDVFVFGEGEYAQYGVLRVRPEAVGVEVYVYRGDTLVMYGSNITTSMQQQAADFNAIYAADLAALTQTYGEPTMDDPQPALDAANTVEADSIIMEDVLKFAGWDLGEGVVLYHLHIKGDGEEGVITIYVNETQMYGAE